MPRILLFPREDLRNGVINKGIYAVASVLHGAFRPSLNYNPINNMNLVRRSADKQLWLTANDGQTASNAGSMAE